jgi:cell shape-determining protein MreD
MKLQIIALAVVTLVTQRLLGAPGMPKFLSMIILPTVWIVALSLMRKERHWPWEALVLGLAWDLLLGPVVGPGGIAWTASCLGLYALAAVVADRSPKAWAAFGAVGGAIVIVVQRLAEAPLGLGTSLTLETVLWSSLLTGLWCGVVGTALDLDLGKRWRAYRLRKLR